MSNDNKKKIIFKLYSIKIIIIMVKIKIPSFMAQRTTCSTYFEILLTVIIISDT